MAAIVAAFTAWYAIAIINTVAQRAFHIWLTIWLTPVPAATIIACLMTIGVRSLWPAATLVALVVGFYGYTALTNAGSDTQAGWIAAHLALAWGVSLAGQIAVGAIAGWLWYRRESRSARPI